MSSGDPRTDGLARVTYLPGVVPPEASVPPEATVAPEPPTFAGFFGDDEPFDSPLSDPSDAATDAESDPDDERVTRRREVSAESVSMKALTRRGLSRWELQKTLLSRDLDPDVVQVELDRLEGVGLLDDAALADTLVRTQHERKGLGRSAIIGELRRRHIDQAHIDLALEQLDVDDEQVRASEIAEKRASQLSSYDLETAKRRLTAFMMRKGYSSSIVRTAVDDALSGRSRSSGSTVRFR